MESMQGKVLRHRFSVEEYHRMGEAGVLSESAHVELVEGEIIEVTPISSRHAACVRRLIRLFSQRLGSSAVVDAQDPVRLDDFSEPQPDITVLRSRDDYYADQHPEPGDVLLLIEVCDSSYEYDRDVKIPLYARSGIVEVWLVHLPDAAVEVYRSPGKDAYAQVSRFQGTEIFSPLEFPQVKVTPEDVLGTV